MREYERTIAIDAPADAVFSYVSDPKHLPEFLPHIQSASAAGGDNLKLQGAQSGRQFAADVQLKKDPTRRHMEWSSGPNYAGSLNVQEGDVASSICELTVHISSGSREENSANSPDERDDFIQDRVEAILRTIQRNVQGRSTQGMGPSGTFL